MRFITRRLPAVLAAAALAAACAACGSSPASSTGTKAAAQTAKARFPVTVTTAGGTVHVPARPTAIVSLAPTATEMLYSIGAGSQVKAVDSDSDYPTDAPITKLSAFEPNAEAIAAYKPDLVIISNNINGIAGKLSSLSIPVLQLPATATLAGEYAEFTELGKATGDVSGATAEVTRLKGQIARIVAALPARTKPLTYYYELSTSPYYSVTSATFIGSVLSLLGMKSIADTVKGAAAAGGYPSLSAEFILKANPKYIILADDGKTAGGQDAATVSARPGWNVLSAVKDKHIILLNADIASRWGPRVGDLLQAVAKAIESGSQ
ncbi:MAG TPA: ABC transporter substrate-binding protein [Streptosporangiaceae bacterium]